jgi:hypothetical protein
MEKKLGSSNVVINTLSCLSRDDERRQIPGKSRPSAPPRRKPDLQSRSAGPACHRAEYEPAQSASALGTVVINATACCTESGKVSELERTDETKKSTKNEILVSENATGTCRG